LKSNIGWRRFLQETNELSLNSKKDQEKTWRDLETDRGKKEERMENTSSSLIF
jgi:hypothetical protein